MYYPRSFLKFILLGFLLVSLPLLYALGELIYSLDRLATEMQAVLKEPAVVKRWEEIGAEASTMTPAEVTRFIQAEIDKWTPVVKSTGAKPE